MVEIVFTNKDSRDEAHFPLGAEDLVFGPYVTLEYKSAVVAPTSAKSPFAIVTGTKKNGAKDVFGLLQGLGWSTYSIAQGMRVLRAGFVVRDAQDRREG
jgi:hypothetical protein